MREILFRGKCKDEEKWAEGALLNLGCGAFIVNSLSDFDCAELEDFSEVYPETVGQFTGLVDAKGKKIFEGDMHISKGDLLVVKLGSFIDCSCGRLGYGWYMENPKNKNCYAFTGEEHTYFYVVGNVHDNDELLKRWIEQ